MSSEQAHFTTQNEHEEKTGTPVTDFGGSETGSFNTYQMRVVAERQCNTMKKNFLFLLKEHNTDPKQSFNCQDFIHAFRQILPNSPADEVKKLFHILEADDMKHDATPLQKTKTISFECMLNNTRNFTKLLHAMSCITEEQQSHQTQSEHCDDDTDAEYSQYSDTLLIHEPIADSLDDDDTDDETNPQQTNSKGVYLMSALAENATTMPRLSFIHTKSNGLIALASKPTSLRGYKVSTRTANTNANGYHYNEYIQHQREQIMELRNRVHELQEYEIKCNELQLILDTKNRQIATQNEEMKQLTQDKDYYFEEVACLRDQYDELLGQYTELDDANHRVSKVHQIQHESTQFMEKQLQQLSATYHESQEFGFKLKEEKHQLNILNTQYVEINDHLRNELQAQRHKSETLKQLLDAKDVEIKHLTLDSLTKDQRIYALQLEAQDVKQYDTYLRHTKSSGSAHTVDRRLSKQHSRQSSLGWNYNATAIHCGSPAPTASVCLEFDLFEEMDVSVYNGDTSGSRRASELIDLHSMKEIEDEKMSEAHTTDYHELMDKIHELEMENEHCREIIRKNLNFAQRKPKMRSIGIQTRRREPPKELGFWEKLLVQAECLCMPVSIETQSNAYERMPENSVL